MTGETARAGAADVATAGGRSHVTHLECGLCGHRVPAGVAATVCPVAGCGRPLLVRYDLAAVARAVEGGAVWARRPGGMWRYRELLPVPFAAVPVSLGEGETPLLEAPGLAAEAGLDRLLVKDEGRLPTGSFKARGLAMAVSMAAVLGFRRIALPSAGNAAGAASAYGARAGMTVDVFVPRDTPEANRLECAAYGARVTLVDGLISDAGKLVIVRQAAEGWFNVATLREPYRIEGKKTMGLELADQFASAWSGGHRPTATATGPASPRRDGDPTVAGEPEGNRGAGRLLPDAIIYPTGGGTGLIGFHKAFAELDAMGGPFACRTVGGAGRPRLYSVQAEGCAPIVRAWRAGSRFAEPVVGAATAASGLRVPGAIGDFLMIDAIRQSGGAAVAGREAEIGMWMLAAARRDGISLCPESAIALSGLRQLVADGAIRRGEAVVMMNCATGLKYPELLRAG